MTHRTKRLGRRMNAAEIAFDLAAKRQAAREKAGKARTAERAADKDPNHWHLNEEALRTQPDVKISRSKGEGLTGAHRKDVFLRMMEEGSMSTAAFDAIRRLEDDMAERRGSSGGSTGEKVSASGSRDLVTQRMLDAAGRIDGVDRGVMPRIGRRDAAFLRELIEPRQVMVETIATKEDDGSVARAPVADRWRQVVSVMLGETQANAQGAALRSACENLAWAYREVDNMPRMAA